MTAVWTSRVAWNRFATEMLGPAVRATISPGSGTPRTVEYEVVEEFLAGAAGTP